MNEQSIAMAKLVGIQKAVRAAVAEAQSEVFRPEHVKQYFHQATIYLQVLKSKMPELYADNHPWSVDAEEVMEAARNRTSFPYYTKRQMLQLARDIDQIFEIRANSGPASAATPAAEVLVRVFVTHGRSKDWMEVQAFIEKDLGLKTMELAQEASVGQTIIEKLETGAAKCDSAVIVMTGDDTDASGVAKARENVMHEIGYFHGKYGRPRVVLLHEDGVNVPTNLSGIVYVPYPKGLVSAAFGVMARELKAVYGV